MEKSGESCKKIKKDLEELQRYVEEFLLFLPLPVCWVNPLGIIIDANKAFYSLTGYQQGGPFRGETIFRAEILFKDKKEWQKLEKRILNKEIIKGEETTIIAKDNKQFPVSLWASCRKDAKGEVIGYFLALSDITKLKEFQEKLEEKVQSRTEELKEERNKNLAVISYLTDGILVFDKDNRLSLINPQAEKFFEVDAKKIFGKPFLRLTAFPNIKPLVSLLGGGIKTLFKKELQIKKHLILEVSTIQMNVKGEKIGTLVILHDITREKLVERMKTEFVTLAAHQLRTPTSAVKWSLRMLLDGDLGKITEKQRAVIEKSYKTNDKVISLITNLLDVEKIEEGEYLSKTTLSDIEEIIQSVADDYRDEMKQRKLKFKFNKPRRRLPKVMIDVEKIKIAVGNLLDNAVRYTPAGGKITISIEIKEKEIEVQIKDTGLGIPNDQQRKVFSKFFRGTNVMKKETEGTGLGLFIAKSVIEAHGGRIWFESRERKGSTFYFTIPVKEKYAEFLSKEFY